MTARERTELWRRWRRRRDGAAFERLVAGEVPYAIDLARRIGADHGEAEDLVQDSLLKLARERSDDPVSVGLRAWICRRVVLGYRMRVRAGSRRRRHERTAMSSGAPRSAPPAAGRALEQRDEVHAALRHLDEEQRRAVVLRYLHDLDYREIAYVLGITENACRLRVHKALKRLRAVLGGSAPALLAALALPASTAQAAGGKALAAAAAAAAGKKTAAGVFAAAGVATVAGAAAVVALVPEDEAPPDKPPAKIAALEPAPPPSAPAPDPEPDPPPAPPSPTGLDRLARHLGGDPEPAARRRDFDAFAGCIAVPDGPVFRIEREFRGVPEGTRVVEFGPGVFDLSRWRLPRGVAALEIRGAGRDRTVLRGRSLLYVEEGRDVPHVRLADLTVEGGLVDVRGAAAVRLERVTVRGWGIRSGYSAPLGSEGRLYLAARDCAFVGGFRRPAGGYALNLRGPALALFERCRFVDLRGAVTGDRRAGRRTSVLLRGCLLENSTAIAPRRKDQPEVLARSCRTVASRPARLGDVLAFLDGLAVPEGARVTGVFRMQWDGLAEPFWAVHLLQDGRRRIEWTPARPDGPSVLAPRLPGRDRLYSNVPLRVALAQARGIDPEREVHAVAEWGLHVGRGQHEPSIAFLDRFGDAVFQVRAITGEVVNDRER